MSIHLFDNKYDSYVGSAGFSFTPDVPPQSFSFIRSINSATGGSSIASPICRLITPNSASPNLYNTITRGNILFETGILAALLSTNVILSASITMRIGGTNNLLSDVNAGVGLYKAINNYVSGQQNFLCGLPNINLATVANRFDFSEITGGILTFEFSDDGIALINTSSNSIFIVMLNVDADNGTPEWVQNAITTITEDGTYHNGALLTVTVGPKPPKDYALGGGKKLFRIQRNRNIFNSQDIV